LQFCRHDAIVHSSSLTYELSLNILEELKIVPFIVKVIVGGVILLFTAVVLFLFITLTKSIQEALGIVLMVMSAMTLSYFRFPPASIVTKDGKIQKGQRSSTELMIAIIAVLSLCMGLILYQYR